MELNIIRILITKSVVKFNYDYKYISNFKLPRDLKIDIHATKYKPEHIHTISKNQRFFDIELIEDRTITTYHLFKKTEILFYKNIF